MWGEVVVVVIGEWYLKMNGEPSIYIRRRQQDNISNKIRHTYTRDVTQTDWNRISGRAKEKEGERESEQDKYLRSINICAIESPHKNEAHLLLHSLSPRVLLFLSLFTSLPFFFMLHRVGSKVIDGQCQMSVITQSDSKATFCFQARAHN